MGNAVCFCFGASNPNDIAVTATASLLSVNNGVNSKPLGAGGGAVFGGVKRRIMFLFEISYFSMHNKVILLPSNLIAAVKSPL